jgi:hypothetical protein
MNEIILAPCDVISKIKQNSSDMNEIILAPCDAGYVQSCTGFNRVCTLCPLYCPDLGDIVGREYIHDSKKGVMRSQFHLTRPLVNVRFPRLVNNCFSLIKIKFQLKRPDTI